METIDEIKDNVCKLYKFRDEYISVYGPECASQKSNDLQEELQKTITKIDSLKVSVEPTEKGHVHFLRGRALNVTSDYSEEAEQELSKATRFNLADAWNELGECRYKKKDLMGAKTCFEKALGLEEKSIYFRNLSMLMRSLPWKDGEEREGSVKKGLEYAKKAVQLDMKDGHSWLVLGNALLTSFFTIDANLDTLAQCHKAYKQAEKDHLAALLPELHYSKHLVQWYEEDYAGALVSLKKALQLEPGWNECEKKMKEGYKFLSTLSLMIEKRGKLSQKRLNSMIKDLKPSHLGVYENGGTSLTGGQKPVVVPLDELREGTNEDKVVLGKVVCTVVPEGGIPFAFCMVDRSGTCVAVSVYNWGSGYGVKIGDSVAVLAPVLKKHSIPADTENEKEISFQSLRVAVPVMLVVNGRQVSRTQYARSQVSSEQKQE